jgi:hypothetical protein
MENNERKKGKPVSFNQVLWFQRWPNEQAKGKCECIYIYAKQTGQDIKVQNGGYDRVHSRRMREGRVPVFPGLLFSICTCKIITIILQGKIGQFCDIMNLKHIYNKRRIINFCHLLKRLSKKGGLIKNVKSSKKGM